MSPNPPCPATTALGVPWTSRSIPVVWMRCINWPVRRVMSRSPSGRKAIAQGSSIRAISLTTNGRPSGPVRGCDVAVWGCVGTWLAGGVALWPLGEEAAEAVADGVDDGAWPHPTSTIEPRRSARLLIQRRYRPSRGRASSWPSSCDLSGPGLMYLSAGLRAGAALCRGLPACRQGLRPRPVESTCCDGCSAPLPGQASCLAD